jgi:hypothetical protein
MPSCFSYRRRGIGRRIAIWGKKIVYLVAASSYRLLKAASASSLAA